MSTAAPATLLQEERPSTGLPTWLNLFRVFCFLLLLPLLGFFLWGGTVESRVNYALIFTLGLLNPLWGVYALALTGPLYLLDQSKTHMLAGLEVFVLGIFAGELRLMARPARESVLLDTRSTALPLVDWGLWPHYLVGMMLMLMASSLIGLQLLVFQEDLPEQYLIGIPFLNSLTQMFYFSGAEPEWTLKSFWNWGTGALLAVLVARRATPVVAARWLKLGSIGLLVACVLSLMEYAGWLTLNQVRLPNPDPLHAGRLQGLAGHGGWFAEWIVMMWPGLLLWWAWGRNKRNAVVAAAMALVGLTLVLTAARAGWLGVGVPAMIAGVYLAYKRPEMRPWLLAAAAGAVVFALIGFVAGGEALRHRIVNILRAQDRANYYVTALHFLRDHPFGLGLGTHFQFYDWTITPFFRWYQTDHVTAHSLWLHTLVEHGIFLPMLLAAGIFGVFLEASKTWSLLPAQDRPILLATAMSFGGIIVVGIAQYIPYLRIIELSTWCAAGLIVGIARHKRAVVTERQWSVRGAHLLLLCGLGALIMASLNAGRSYPGMMPRNLQGDEEGLKFWTGQVWSAPVDNEIDVIHFSLNRKFMPVEGTVSWPNGHVEHYRLGVDEWRYFRMERESREATWWRRHPKLTITATPLATPSNFDPESNDDRQLGVWVHGLQMESPRLRQLREEYEARLKAEETD